MSPYQLPENEVAQAIVLQLCKDFGVDPDEVTEVTMESEGKGSVVIFQRTPLRFPVPKGYKVTARVPK